MNLKLPLLVVTILFFISNFSLASEHVRLGSDFTIEIDNQGILQPSTISIFTDVAEMQGQEMTVSVRSARGRTALRTVVVPTEDGVYSFPIDFDSVGEWGVWMRYGLGLETYERVRRFQINDVVGVVEVGSSSFRGTLRPDVPDYVQPMGYAIFLTLLLCTLLMLGKLFYWINRQHTTKAI